MKSLAEIIASLENQLADADETKTVALHLSLAEHLDLVNNKLQHSYVQKILDNALILPNDIRRINAEILMVGLVLNQMKASDALDLANTALAKAIDINNPSLILKAKIQKAISLQYNGMTADALSTIENCIVEATQQQDIELIRSSKTYASFIYSDKDLTLSGQYAMDALMLAKQSGKQWLVGYAHAVLGYWARENKVEVDEYFHFMEAEQILRKEGAEEYHGNILSQLAICEKDRANFEVAFSYLERALVIFKKIGNVRLNVINTISLGRLYRAQKEYDKAEKHYQEALKLATEYKIEYENGVVHILLAHLYRDMEKYQKSIFYFESAIALWGDKIRPSTKADIGKHLHAVYYKVNDLEKAYKSLLDYTDIRFKLQDENRIKETAQLQTKYETEKREAELRESRLQQTESELKALKAQMNPHFIFNALNSIQEIFFLGDKRLANKHLSRFSTLMRSILKASNKMTITLQEEIVMLEEYLTLEGLRFGEDFSFAITMDDNVDPYTFDVPPMIIQPFVENAVKHGLLHKEGNQKIELHFSFDEEKSCIEVLVKDNGVGRKASAAINQHRKNHDSFSTSATEKRFEILNQNREPKFEFWFDDIEDDNSISLGTAVKIILPLE